jgi:hypothetical protein
MDSSVHTPHTPPRTNLPDANTSGNPFGIQYFREKPSFNRAVHSVQNWTEVGGRMSFVRAVHSVQNWTEVGGRMKQSMVFRPGRGGGG